MLVSIFPEKYEQLLNNNNYKSEKNQRALCATEKMPAQKPIQYS
jgi:hypothetical protein